MSHEIMAHECALAAVPMTSNFDLSFHPLDFVHHLKMVGNILLRDLHVAW